MQRGRDARSRRRFFNHTLKGSIYDACALPTVLPFNAPNALLESSYQRVVERRSAWDELTFSPPDGAKKLHPGALGCLRHLHPPPQPLPPRKRPCTGADAGAPPASSPDPIVDDEPKRKAGKPFQRQAALDGQLRTFKVLMLPSKEQREELRRAFKVARRAYNTANEWVKTKAVPNANFIALRTRWNTLPPPAFANTPETRVHNKIAARAIKQLSDAYATNIAKVRKGTLRGGFNIRFRSERKTKTEVLVLEKGSNGPVRGFQEEAGAPSTRLRTRGHCRVRIGGNLNRHGSILLQDSPRVIGMLLAHGDKPLEEDAMIMWDKPLGRFYFIYTYVQPRLQDPDPAFTSKRVVACDPGCSPFQEWYSPTSGEFGALLTNGGDDMQTRCKRLDTQHARLARKEARRKEARGTPGGSKRRRMVRRRRRQCAKGRARLSGWMQAGHYDAANFLLRRHDVVLQPALAVASLSKRESRLLRTKAVRKMYTWSHYLFRQRLQSAASRYPGRHVFVTSEPGTSKTCTHCGKWFAGLTLGHKRYQCAHCGLEVDRQLAGARNNFFAAYGHAAGIGWDGRSD